MQIPRITIQMGSKLGFRVCSPLESRALRGSARLLWATTAYMWVCKAQYPREIPKKLEYGISLSFREAERHPVETCCRFILYLLSTGHISCVSELTRVSSVSLWFLLSLGSFRTKSRSQRSVYPTWSGLEILLILCSHQ